MCSALRGSVSILQVSGICHPGAPDRFGGIPPHPCTDRTKKRAVILKWSWVGGPSLLPDGTEVIGWASSLDPKPGTFAEASCKSQSFEQAQQENKQYTLCLLSILCHGNYCALICSAPALASWASGIMSIWS